MIIIWDFIFPETMITPETFAEVLCDDLDLPATSFVTAIAQAIRQQAKQFEVEPEITLNEQKDQRIVIKVFVLCLYRDFFQLQLLKVTDYLSNDRVR